MLNIFKRYMPRNDYNMIDIKFTKENLDEMGLMVKLKNAK